MRCSQATNWLTRPSIRTFGFTYSGSLLIGSPPCFVAVRARPAETFSLLRPSATGQGGWPRLAISRQVTLLRRGLAWLGGAGEHPGDGVQGWLDVLRLVPLVFQVLGHVVGVCELAAGVQPEHRVDELAGRPVLGIAREVERVTARRQVPVIDRDHQQGALRPRPVVQRVVRGGVPVAD